jgi:hypothetical protein
VSDLKDILRGDDILDDTEATLKQWIVQVVEQEVMNARVAAAVQKIKKEKALNETKQKSSLATPICVTPSEGALLLQESLVQHRSSGPPDHLATATIIHELTSPTYTAPPSKDDLMGNVWWRKIHPQDWEEHFLPKGWQEWNVALPRLIRSSIGTYTYSYFSFASTLLLLFGQLVSIHSFHLHTSKTWAYDIGSLHW